MTQKGQSRNAYPAMRIFIYGLEVTEDVLTCTCNWSDDDRAPSTAEFVLANKNDKYTMTPAEIALLNPEIDVELLQLTSFQQMATRSIGHAISDAIIELGIEVEEINTFAVASNAANRAKASGQKRRNENQQVLSNAVGTLETSILHGITELLTPPKQDVVLSKFSQQQALSQAGIEETGDSSYIETANPRRLAYLSGFAYTYEFVANAPIFHSNDPVRIFWRDPLDPSAWFYMHTGFITDWTRSVDVNNVNTLTIRCEDVLRDLRYSRITSNPGVLDIERAKVEGRDLVFRSFFNETFSGLTMPEIVYTIIFGPDTADTIDRLPISESNREKFRAAKPRGTTRTVVVGNGTIRTKEEGSALTTTRSQLGVGSFNLNRSAIFFLGEETEAPDGEAPLITSSVVASREVRLVGDDSLGVYQALIDHQVLASDIDSMIVEEAQSDPTVKSQIEKDLRYDSSGKATPESVVGVIGRNPHIFPVDAGRVFMLLPASLGNKVSRRVILRDFVQSVATQTEFKTRLAVLFDMIERIEFSFYASPKGDLIIEMPLYDFEPRDWGEKPISEARARSLVQQSRTEIGELIKAVDLNSLHSSLSVGTLSGNLGDISTRLQFGPSGGLSLTPQTGLSPGNLQLGIDPARASLTLSSNVQAAAISRRIAAVADGAALGPYSTRYRVALKDTMDVQQTFSDERIKTRMECGWNIIPGMQSTGNSRSMGLFTSITLDALIPRFGVRSARCDDKLIVNSEEAAKIYCQLKINQENAEAISSTIDMIPQIRLGPNRPIQVAEGEYVATVRSIAHTLDWAGRDMSSTVGVNYTRPWDGSVRRIPGEKAPIPRYPPLGGYASRPLNYAVLLGFHSPKTSAQVRDDPKAATWLYGPTPASEAERLSLIKGEGGSPDGSNKLPVGEAQGSRDDSVVLVPLEP